MVDPAYPGAVDAIINLGEYWNEDLLVKAKNQVVDLNKRIKQLFQVAFNSLKEARVVHDELTGYYSGALDQVGVNKQIFEVSSGVLTGIEPVPNRAVKVRRLFASANTPNGPVSYLDSLLEGVRKLYLFKGEPGTGKEKALQVLLSETVRLGMDCEVYHCPLEPQKLEAVNIPAINTAAVRLNERLVFDPKCLTSLENLEFIDFNKYLNERVCQVFTREIEEAKKRLEDCFLRAWRKLSEAKMLHDDLEKLYVGAMNFAEIDKIREKTLKRILALGGLYRN
ncbi:MAG: hypothetical protein QHH10_13770 [Peptococcaceae bacterium]|nr:hypothetical protein [Peptococcaceae bacterium]MDH7526362.1 hypothetical protein [Peptococcaceae bacterium]